MSNAFTSLIGVVTANDDDDRILPTLSAPGDSFPIEFTELDGTDIMYFTASTLDLRRQHKDGTHQTERILDEHEIVGAVTDARVVFACEKYDKGGGWIGVGAAGFTFALAANAVSKVRAARRRQGTVLVGQVRYPWLAFVGTIPSSWWGKSQLALAAYTSKAEGGGGQTLTLHSPVSESVDVHELAAEIARRASAWRLRYDTFASPDTRTSLETLTRAKAKKSMKGSKNLATHTLPNSYSVEEFTAFAMNKRLNDDWARARAND